MKKIKTAAYCRVSTDKEAQDGSYELQVSYYKDMIKANTTMELVGIYGDKGKSGWSTEKRPGLQKLIDDCRAGKIDLILTKSISRFSRNMAECAAMIRELKDLGVNIIFEKENINSQNEKCAFVLNIFAAIAEEESHSISQHTLLAHEQHAMEGNPFGQISFGYKNGGDNKWVINGEEAPLVIKAFKMAAEGKNYTDIQRTLNEMSGFTWSHRRLKYLLTNVVYKGDYQSHKTISLVPGKQVKNNGYRDQFYITEHHEPIVSPELFDRVQEIMNRYLLASRKQPRVTNQTLLRDGERFVENSNEN
jgi:DNA invertase Pin-like site-specific DNA recombinase